MHSFHVKEKKWIHVLLESIVKRRETNNYIAVWTCLTTHVHWSSIHYNAARVRICSKLNCSEGLLLCIRCYWKKVQQNKRRTMNRFFSHLGFIQFIQIYLMANRHPNVGFWKWREVKNKTYCTQFIVFIVDFVIILFIVRCHYIVPYGVRFLILTDIQKGTVRYNRLLVTVKYL